MKRGRRQLPSPWLIAAFLVPAACVGSIAGGAGPGGPGGGGNPGAGGAPPGGGGIPGASGGQGGSNGPVTPAHTPLRFTCDPAAAAPVTAWRRLGVGQYRSTLRDLLTFALGDAAAATAAMNAVGTELGRLPADQRPKIPQDLHGTFHRLDQDVEQLHVEVGYGVAVGLGAYLTGGARFAAVAGACAADADPGNDGACLDAFIQKLGPRAMRRPLESDELAFYRRLHGASATPSSAAGYADVIAGLLTAPQFLYHVEHGAAAVPGRTAAFALSAHELASRLSYHFWETMPDGPLLAAASSGALTTAEGYRAQVDRLFADPRTRPTIESFLRDWLKLDDMAPLDARNANPVFRAFAAADLPRASLQGEMIEDVLGMARHTTWNAGTFDDLLLGERSFARGADLARLYGVAAWDGTSAPPTFPAGQRPGLFTRAAFLATGSPTTRPVMKGVFLRHNVLCDEIPPPPDNAMANFPELDPALSTRQVVEKITEAPASSCAVCHARFINPIGFATEGFDALGRVRTSQPLFDDAGRELTRAPVDTRSVPQIIDGDLTPSTGPADLMRLMAESGKAHACFARQYFRFTFGRWEDLGADGCVLERLRLVLARKAPLTELLREIALSPEFQQRTIR